MNNNSVSVNRSIRSDERGHHGVTSTAIGGYKDEYAIPVVGSSDYSLSAVRVVCHDGGRCVADF